VTGRFHLHVRVHGHEVIADHREPIAGVIERVHRARHQQPVREPETSDVDAILAWYEQNAAMVARCAAGRCDHAV
jgi:hypothetical protein